MGPSTRVVEEVELDGGDYALILERYGKYFALMGSGIDALSMWPLHGPYDSFSEAVKRANGGDHAHR
jgi:hypothetical protein